MATKSPKFAFPKGNAQVGDRVLVSRDSYGGNVEPWFNEVPSFDKLLRGEIVKVGVGPKGRYVSVKFDGVRRRVAVSPHRNIGLIVWFVPKKVPAKLKRVIPKGFAAVRLPGNSDQEVFGIIDAETLEQVSIRERITEYADLKFCDGFYQGKPSIDSCDYSFVVADREIELRTEIEVEPYN